MTMESLTVSGRKWVVLSAMASFALLRSAVADGDGLGLGSTSVVAICESANAILYQEISVSPTVEHPIWSIDDPSTNTIRSMERRRVLAAVESILISNKFCSAGLSISEAEIFERTTNLLDSAFGAPIFTAQMASNQQAQIDALINLANICVTNSDAANDFYQSQYANTIDASTWNRMKQLCQTTNGVAQFQQLYPQKVSASTVSNQFTSIALRLLWKEKVIGHLVATTEIRNAQGYVEWLYNQLGDVQFLVPELDPRETNSPAPLGGIGGPEPELPSAEGVP